MLDFIRQGTSLKDVLQLLIEYSTLPPKMIAFLVRHNPFPSDILLVRHLILYRLYNLENLCNGMYHLFKYVERSKFHFRFDIARGMWFSSDERKQLIHLFQRACRDVAKLPSILYLTAHNFLGVFDKHATTFMILFLFQDEHTLISYPSKLLDQLRQHPNEFFRAALAVYGAKYGTEDRHLLRKGDRIAFEFVEDKKQTLSSTVGQLLATYFMEKGLWKLICMYALTF